MPIKAGWWQASLALWNFSRGDKHCIHLSTTKTIYFSRFVFAMSAFQKQSSGVAQWKKFPEACNFIKKEALKQVFSCEFCEIFKNNFFHGKPPVWLLPAFAQIEISHSNTVCNTLAAETWICLVSFYGGEWWSKRLYFRMYFPQTNQFIHWNINVTSYF